MVKATADVNDCVKSKIKLAWRVKVESEGAGEAENYVNAKVRRTVDR